MKYFCLHNFNKKLSNIRFYFIIVKYVLCNSTTEIQRYETSL